MSLIRIQSSARMSQVVVHGNTAYLSGQVDLEGKETTVAGQTRAVLNRIDALLLAAGSSKQELISATIWLTDMAAFEKMNAVWDAWLAPGSAPTSATVEAGLASPKFLVEIAVIAAVSSPAR